MAMIPLLRRAAPSSQALPRHLCKLQNLSTATAEAPPSFKFKCTQCGKCCTGKGGRVRVNDREIEELQRVLRLSTRELQDTYLSPSEDPRDNQWLIKQTQDDTQCVFLEGKRCSVYEARPTQCRTFPWWPQNLISSYDWRLAARNCEGIVLDTVSSRTDSGNVQRLDEVLPDAIVYDIHRSGENYSYEELHELLRDLQELDPSFLDEYMKELREKFHRRVVYTDDCVTVLDTFLDGALPSRSFVFNDRLHLVQSEMLLLQDGSGCVDPSRLVLDVHQAMYSAAKWLASHKTTDWSVAVLGSGGGSLVRHILYEQANAVVQLDAVEPDSTVNEVAKVFFGLNDAGPQLRLHEEYGEDFVQRQLGLCGRERRLYDLFVIDVEAGSPEDNVLAPPVSMLSHEFLRGVIQLLSEVGVVTINVITEDDHALKQVATAVAQAFGGDQHGASHCLYARLPKNTVIFAFKDASHSRQVPARGSTEALSSMEPLLGLL